MRITLALLHSCIVLERMIDISDISSNTLTRHPPEHNVNVRKSIKRVTVTNKFEVGAPQIHNYATVTRFLVGRRPTDLVLTNFDPLLESRLLVPKRVQFLPAAGCVTYTRWLVPSLKLWVRKTYWYFEKRTGTSLAPTKYTIFVSEGTSQRKSNFPTYRLSFWLRRRRPTRNQVTVALFCFQRVGKKFAQLSHPLSLLAPLCYNSTMKGF